VNSLLEFIYWRAQRPHNPLRVRHALEIPCNPGAAVKEAGNDVTIDVTFAELLSSHFIELTMIRQDVVATLAGKTPIMQKVWLKALAEDHLPARRRAERREAANGLDLDAPLALQAADGLGAWRKV
jgi:hypothetical protein